MSDDGAVADDAPADGATTAASAASDDGRAPSRATQWVLVGVVLTCLVGAPVAVLFWPPTFVPYRDAYLGLSLVPGLVLGAIGAWTATR